MNLKRAPDAAAIVLAGGRSSRMGVAKVELEVGGATMIERVLQACAGAGVPAVVVGAAEVPAGTSQLLEHPPGAGPVHALAWAAIHAHTQRTFTLAADLPFLHAGALAELREALDRGGDVVVAVDDRGRRQYLLALWHTAALREALRAVGGTVDASLRSLYASADVCECALRGTPPPWWDCDTPDALATARAWIGTDMERGALG